MRQKKSRWRWIIVAKSNRLVYSTLRALRFKLMPGTTNDVYVYIPVRQERLRDAVIAHLKEVGVKFSVRLVERGSRENGRRRTKELSQTDDIKLPKQNTTEAVGRGRGLGVSYMESAVSSISEDEDNIEPTRESAVGK